MFKLFRKNKSVLGIIIILGFLVYCNALGAGMFWDDDDGILKNTYLRSWDYWGKYFSENLIAGAGLESNYWRPLLLIGYSLEWNLWGAFPPGYHLVNIILHILATIFLFLILKKILQRRMVSFWTALVFLIHPVQTEAVTYVSGRADPLSAFLIFGGLYFYLKARKWKNKFFGWTLLFFVLGLMTKEKTVLLFPTFLLLIDLYYFYKEEEKRAFVFFVQEEIKKHWPVAGLGGVYVLLRATVLNFKDTFNLYSEVNPYTESILVRTVTFLKLIPEYFQLMFWPFSLHMERKADFVTSFEPAILGGAGIILFLLGIVFYFRNSKPRYSFAAAWFLIAMFPISGILAPVSGLIWEHYLYLPLIGIFLLIALFLEDLFSNYLRSKKIFLIVPAIGWLIFLGGLTIQRNQVWKNPITFYNDIIKYNTDSLRVWNNLGMAYAEKGEYQEAINAYKKAIALDEGKVSAPPYHNLGNIYQELGETEEAIGYYNKALEVDERFFFSYLALTNLYFSKKEYTEAITILEKAQKKIPEQKEIEQAIREIKRINKQEEF